MRPVLEELPKWNILSEIMDEVEVEMHNAPHSEGIILIVLREALMLICYEKADGAIQFTAIGLDTVLIMAQDQRTCSQLRRYLSTPKTNTSTRGKPLMRDLLHGYLRWKSNMKHFNDNVASKTPTTLSSAMASSGILWTTDRHIE
jgi:DNA excision repair protein ERCC-4